jgi:hypothetical protein
MKKFLDLLYPPLKDYQKEFFEKFYKTPAERRFIVAIRWRRK